jgi:hypothetical protein
MPVNSTGPPSPSAARAQTFDGSRPRQKRRIWWLLGVAVVAMVAAGGLKVHLFVTRVAPTPSVPPLDVVELVSDTRPIPIRTTVSWKKVPEVVTVHRLLTDHPLWQRMHFDDWDRVPRELRERALAAMVRAFAYVLEGPSAWKSMTPAEWDRVPQPIRAMAYLRMIWYWARHEEVGAEFGLEPARLAPTIGAIVMAESWFEHRAINENAFGNRDLGLAQCSDYCRESIGEMAESGEIEFEPSEADYFNPWVATRVATVWFERELGNAEGDIDLAIRAYHRGIDNAFDEKGDTYLLTVHRRRDRYILNRGASPSWRFLARTVAAM